MPEYDKCNVKTVVIPKAFEIVDGKADGNITLTFD